MNSGYSNNSVFKNALALTTLNIGNNVTNIPDYAFYGCSKLAGRLDIPNSVTNIGQLAFYGCSELTGRLEIPNSVISIGYGTFNNCSGFSSIIIGERVNSIGDWAIYCIGVDTIYSNAINPPILGSFNCVNESIPVIVPCGCIPAYNNHNRWCVFANIQQSPDCVGVEKNEFASIDMYPNPVSNTLYINNEETISEIEIENTLGQVVKRIEVNADNAVCNVEDLKAGLYIVRIYGTNTESVVCQRKFIKE